MKRTIYFLIITLLMLSNISFATTTEYIEFASGETDDGSIYLDSYEDYLNAVQGVDEQELHKEEHLKMIAESIANYDLTKRPDVVKARVLSVEETEEYYSYDNYGTYKIKYQPINVQILEGKYKNQTFDMTYILTADTYENIKVKEIKENQKINVIIEDVNGKPYVYGTTIDSSVDRVGYLIALIVITIILFVIFLGKKALKALPPLILIADIILLVFVPELMVGRSILWMTVITMILYLITNTTIKVGLNEKTVPAMLTTFAVVLITTILLNIFNNISSMSGIIFEITTIIESFPKGTIDFASLNLSIYILMSTIATSEIACKVINTYKEKESKIEIKEYVSEKILTVSAVLLITIIPKYLYMLISKYTYTELINSEMLINEIGRILFLIISMLITTEVGIFTKKMLVEEK